MVKNINKNIDLLKIKSKDATKEDINVAIDLIDTLKFNSSHCVGMAANMIGYLKNAIIYLNVTVNMDENLIIKGDVNILVQVINNMISNSIQSYEGKPEQSIDLTASNSSCE